MIGDGGTGSCLLLSLYPSIVDAFGITVVRTELGVTRVAVFRRQQCKWVGLPFTLDMAHTTVES